MMTSPDLTDNPRRLVKRISAELDRNGYTKRDLAEHLGLTESGLSRVFSRAKAAKYLDAIAGFLRLSPQRLTVLDGFSSEDDIVKLSPGCLLVRMAGESANAFGRGQWATLAAAIEQPVAGSIVAIQDAKLGWKLRAYQLDAAGVNVVLSIGKTTEVFALAKKPAMRVVLAIGTRPHAR